MATGCRPAVILLSYFVCLTSYATDANVILITWDGVRWQDLFDIPDPDRGWSDGLPTAPRLSERLFNEGVVFGNRYLSNDFLVGNPMNLSLPGYQCMMAGKTQPCLGNDCGRIGVETLPERLVRELNVSKEQVALIASWEKLKYSVEHKVGSVFVSAGNHVLRDSIYDSELGAINLGQLINPPPWEDSRYDRYTMAHAFRYLRVHHPRFLFVSLGDSDSWGHRGEYKKYIETLRQYDTWLEELFSKLEGMGEYGANTTVLVATDHGRGRGSSWVQHSIFFPASRFAWLYAKGPRTMPQGFVRDSKIRTQLDIRPTIEKLLGLKPIQCDSCGSPLPEIVGQ